MANQAADEYSEYPVLGGTEGDPSGEAAVFLAVCPWSAMTYTWMLAPMAASAVRRRARRRREIRALERTFARV